MDLLEIINNMSQRINDLETKMNNQSQVAEVVSVDDTKGQLTVKIGDSDVPGIRYLVPSFGPGVQEWAKPTAGDTVLLLQIPNGPLVAIGSFIQYDSKSQVNTVNGEQWEEEIGYVVATPIPDWESSNGSLFGVSLKGDGTVNIGKLLQNSTDKLGLEIQPDGVLIKLLGDFATATKYGLEIDDDQAIKLMSDFDNPTGLELTTDSFILHVDNIGIDCESDVVSLGDTNASVQQVVIDHGFDSNSLVCQAESSRNTGVTTNHNHTIPTHTHKLPLILAVFTKAN